MKLPVDPSSSAQSTRRTLLRLGERYGWWKYESENEGGYEDRRGYVYHGTTYTIVRPGDGPTVDRERVLLADEVVGYVLATADHHGQAAEVAYREGLTD